MTFIPFLRALAGTYQAFTALSNKHVRTEGLTNPQFDVIATLGQKVRMTTSELGRETLITKGTLTGVLDRLEEKNLICRQHNSDDKRSVKVSLTDEGTALFNRVFQEHISFISPAFNVLTEDQLMDITMSLLALEKSFAAQASQD